MNLRAAMVAVAGFSLCVGGCGRSGSDADNAGEVVIYTSIDDPYVRPLVQRFERKTGIKVTLVADGEATKTAGLVEKILAEKGNPRADVYWGNEIFHTINLAGQGVFARYRSPVAEDVPARWRDKNDLYVDMGLRARMIVVSTRPEYRELVGRIKGLKDLADPPLKGKIGISHPGFGTASGQVAAWYVLLGDEKTNQLLRGLRANEVKLLGGNSAVVEQVAEGGLVAGLTDNDDVSNAKAEGQKIDGVVPDQDGDGTLMIPTTIALVKGGPNAENGKKLIDFLMDPAVEKELIAKRFLGYSVRTVGNQVKAMDVDYALVAGQMRSAVEKSLAILQDRTPAK